MIGGNKWRYCRNFSLHREIEYSGRRIMKNRAFPIILFFLVVLSLPICARGQCSTAVLSTYPGCTGEEIANCEPSRCCGIVDPAVERALALRSVLIEVRENSVPVEGAVVTITADDPNNNGYRLLDDSPVTTDAGGIALCRVLFGYDGSAAISYSAEYNAQPCGSGTINLSVDHQDLSGTVHDGDTSTPIDSFVAITNVYSGELAYAGQNQMPAGDYSANLPVSDYLIHAFAVSQTDYHQVLVIEAEMTKGAPAQKDVPLTKELCNGADDDGDGQVDEDFADAGFNNFGPLGGPCQASSGVCAGNYVCSDDKLATVCETHGASCEFCTDFATDPDDDLDVYRGQCSYEGVCSHKYEDTYVSFLVFPENKEDCSSGCTPETTELEAVGTSTCTE